jgi:5-methylcytosine-specific restriction enzyme subunit McrC
MTIPIRNLYYLFTYAWGRFPAGAFTEVGIEDCPDLPNLFARLLIGGINRLLRRGLDRSYRECLEELRGARGKLLIDRIIKEQTLRRAGVICSYDDLTPNVLHNQILKATCGALSRTRNVTPEYRHELGLIVQRMHDIQDIRLSRQIFGRVQLSRNTGQYAPLLRLCELVFNSLLPDEQGAGWRFADVLKDEVVMSSVFEDFLRNFYAYEQPQYSVSREIMSWDAIALEDTSTSHLPIMETDITLRAADRVLVLDAKYYREALVERYGTRKVRSGHLYQLSAYLTHAAKRHRDVPVAGGLIYPALGDPIRLLYQIEGRKVLVASVDLASPWEEIRTDLLSLLQVLAGERGVTTVH